jgi:2-polyprenyl-3-methyl-5-hydroxy-6-metoxy-1,4-benzoquinol methylase
MTTADSHSAAHRILTDLRASTVVAAALAGALVDERAGSPGEALELDHARAAVLHSLPDAESTLRALWEGRSARGNALVSTLSQATAAAAGSTQAWSDVSREAMIAQGRASALMARVILSHVAPAYGFLAPSGADRVLDVGTGIGAIATILAESGPGVHVTGIDIAERPLQIARDRLAEAGGGLAERVRFRHQDVVALDDIDAYDVAWMPVPFLPDGIIDTAMTRVGDALRPGGLLVLGTMPGEPDQRLRAANAWLASLAGGSTLVTDDVVARLDRLGFGDVRHFDTVPGGPVLVAAIAPPLPA